MLGDLAPFWSLSSILKDIPVRRQLAIGAITCQCLLLIVTVTSAVSLSGSSGVLESIVNDSVVRIGRLNEGLDLINARELHLATILATGDPLVAQEESDRLTGARLRTADVLKVLHEHTPEDRMQYLRDLDDAMSSLNGLENLFLEQVTSGHKVEAEVVFVRGIHTQAEAGREAMRAYLKAEQDRATTESIRQATQNIFTLRMIILLTFACLLGGTLVSIALTRSVSRAYDQVQSLKMQQDGDYFLTALLQGQLVHGNCESRYVRMKSRIIQYKNFSFKNRGYSIGGDFCYTDSIVLRNRTYAVFLNADAMGKSMQGAGGALVLGAVFRAIMERTRIQGAVREQYPERWLKNAFLEMHGVLLGFEGSMLVSLILGLLDERSGNLFYVNAAHPLPVLFRNGKASFLQETHHLHKAGTPGLEGLVSVRLAQLQTGDIVILGSDGRDEVRLKSPNLQDQVNLDDYLFLEFVEAGEGDIDRIRAKLTEAATLTDDLSLVQIELIAPEIERSDAEYASNLRNTAAILASAGNYAEAATQFDQLVELAPTMQDLFIGSYYCRKAGRLARAADLGERLRLRRPTIIKNLLHLARIYFLMGNFGRAITLAEEAIALEPGRMDASRFITLAKNRASDNNVGQFERTKSIMVSPQRAKKGKQIVS